MENDFFKYICSLAPEGETALIVKQIDTGKLYLDGTIKYTWPAYMPTHKRKSGEAWFINTGSFIVDRFRNGKPSASTANCEHVLFMMLDDIGTKSKTPPLEPTWIIETSPGNFQWGYVYSEQPTTGEHCAAITAIARAGYSDPGATNAVRNCRLPGSTNQKPGRDSFEARLVEFSRKEYTLAEICAALDVVPDEASTAKYISYSIKDTGKDNVLTWLNEQSLVLSNVNPEGWLGIVCPNNHEHTDGNIGARYKPIDRSFCCYHGHCTDKIKSAEFLKWVCDNGGPDEKHGLRDDVIMAEMQEMNAKLPPNTMFNDDAEKLKAEVDFKEMGRTDKGEWYDKFLYVVADDAYFNLITRREITRRNFDALFRHVACTSVIHVNDKGKGRIIPASIAYDENRQSHEARVLEGITYAAGDKETVTRDGFVYGNKWIDARPKVHEHTADIKRWRDHCEFLLPDNHERNHCYDVMAFKLKNPTVKINHAVLHVGRGGLGKDTMWSPFFWAVGGPSIGNGNMRYIGNEELNTGWGYKLETEILVLNELKEGNASERRALANKLKPLIAAPPMTLTVNRKGLHPYELVNRMFVMAFSNEDIPIVIESEDRRWFCIKSYGEPMDNPKEFWNWLWAEGFNSVAKWLYARDVSKFNPGMIAPWTDFKASLVETGMSYAESHLVELIRDRSGPFKYGVIGGPFHELCREIADALNNGTKVPPAALLHALREAGWLDMGRCMSSTQTTKKHIFCAPGFRDKTRAVLRDMVADYEKNGSTFTALNKSNGVSSG
jgi:hypothetical protein